MDELPRQIRCSVCNKPLSVPPIYHKTAAGSLCGRCAHKVLINGNNDNFVRQRVFEETAKYLFFPCSYQVFGCTAKLKWESVRQHENFCAFKTIMCPLSHEYFKKQCPWIDEHKNLTDHIKTKHKNMFCGPPTMKITKELENRIIFWEITGRVIIIMLAFNKTLNKYFCYILGDFISEDCNSFQCEVSICGDDSTSPLIIKQQCIQPLTAKTFKELKESMQIDPDTFLHFFDTSDELTLRFTIAKEVKSIIEPGLNEKLLSRLECPVCFEYMKAPIFNCQAGHNFCEGCSNKIKNCPICRGNLLGGRNFTLEEVTKVVQYPCVYKNFGCSFVDYSERVGDHERYCHYIGRKCFMEICKWKGLHGDLLKHLEDEHSPAMNQLNTIYRHNGCGETRKYLLLYNDDIFLLKLTLENFETFKFAVLHYEREATTYNYTLQLITASSRLNVTVANKCQPVPFHVDIMTYDNYNSTYLPLDFIQQFMLCYSKIEFKLNVMKD